MGRKNVTDGWIRGLAARLPDGWLGRADEMERRYRSAYISGSPRTLILEAKTRTLRRYALLSGLLLCVSAAMVVSGGRGDLSDISRDEYGGDARTVSAEVEAVYGDEKVKRNVSVRVLPKEVEPGAVAREMESRK
ncbi:MAG: hypothetical protein LBL63_03605, partial [Clostridiales Family XIII bacterium]|nr:hypothetical protein [Clostridiales Family XIII bacterium]